MTAVPELPNLTDPPGPGPAPVRRPSTLGGLVYLIVVAVSVAGLATIAFGPWRQGVTLVGVALLIGAAARLVLTSLNAGMLRVRSKAFDVVVLAGTGVGLILLAHVIPNQTT